MNRKQFAILVVLLVVFGGAGWFAMKGRDRESSAGEQGAGVSLLGKDFPINDVAQMRIQDGSNVVNLVKGTNVWRVSERDNYPASFSVIGELLLKLGDLKIVQVEEVAPSQLARLQLAPQGQGTNSGELFELMDKNGKLLKSLVLGKPHLQKPAHPSPFGDDGYADGRYVMVSGKSQTALLVADPLSSVEPKPEEWLAREFFRVSRPKSIALNFPAATNSWKITRDSETADWKFAAAQPDEKLDPAKAAGVSRPFESPTFSDVLPHSAKPADYGLDQPTVLNVETFENFNYTINIGKKTGDNYPVTVSAAADIPRERVPPKDEKPEDKDKAETAFHELQRSLMSKLADTQFFSKWTFLVPSYLVEPVLKDRKDLLPEKKEEKTDEPKAANPAAQKDAAAPPTTGLTP